jgi:HEAT repeat protein
MEEQKKGDIDSLLIALKDRDSRMREQAARALGELGDPAAIAALIRATHDKADRVSTAARNSLDRLGWSPPHVLDRIGEIAVKPLVQALKDRKIGLVENIFRTDVASLQKQGAVDELIALLKHKDSGVRREAAEALGELTDPLALEPLLQSLTDLDPDVQHSARRALESLGWRPESEVSSENPLERGRYLVLRKRWAELEAMGELAVDPLIEALNHGDKYVRWRAARTLGRLGNPKATEYLMIALRDEDAGVLKGVTFALGKLVGEHLLTPVIQVLTVEDEKIRLKAADVLARTHDPRVIDPLIRTLHKELQNQNEQNCTAVHRILELLPHSPTALPSVEVANLDSHMGKTMVETVTQEIKETPEPMKSVSLEGETGEVQSGGLDIGLPKEENDILILLKNLESRDQETQQKAVAMLDARRGDGLTDSILGALRDPEDDVRKASAYALGLIGDLRAIQPLVDTLEDTDERVVREAILALGKMQNPGAVEPLIKLLSSSSVSLRTSAVVALGQLADPLSTKALINALHDENTEVRISAVHSLGRFHDPASIRMLAGALVDPDEKIRLLAMDVLIRIGAPAVTCLIAAFKDRNTELRTSAAKILVSIGFPAVEPLVHTLKDRSDLVRWRAARALGEIGDTRAIEPLIQALGEADCFLRRDAGDALHKMGLAAVQPLIKALSMENKDIRKEAAEVLGRVGDQTAVDSLLASLKDPSPEVRGTAAWALGEIGSPAANELLGMLLQDPDPHIRGAAEDALKKIKQK